MTDHPLTSITRLGPPLERYLEMHGTIFRTFDRQDSGNRAHRHSGIGYHTPADVHAGRHRKIRAARQTVLDQAYASNPHRFRQRPRAPKIEPIAYINQPDENLSHTP